jgi:hypothetical protein
MAPEQTPPPAPAADLAAELNALIAAMTDVINPHPSGGWGAFVVRRSDVLQWRDQLVAARATYEHDTAQLLHEITALGAEAKRLREDVQAMGDRWRAMFADDDDSGRLRW